MQQAAGRELLVETLEKIAGQSTLGEAKRGCIPLLAFHIVDGNEGRLSSHREPNIACAKLLIDTIAQRENPAPLLVGVRLGYARVFVNACDPHLVMKPDFANAHCSRDGRGRQWFRRS